MFRRPTLAASSILSVLALAPPAHAELPDPVRAMIEAAIEAGDPDKVAAVVEFAKATNPDDADVIDDLHDAFEAERQALAAAEAERQRLELSTAGLLENWSGRGEVGGFHATGNSENVGVTASLSAERKGIDWTHKLRGRANYQRNNGRTSREQYVAAYEPRYSFGPRLFGYALAQFEHDRFQGFDSRLSTSGGVGYQVVDSEDLDLSLKVGPAFRKTNFTNGDTDSSFGALAGLDVDWRLLPQLTLTQDANLVASAGGSAVAIIDNRSSTVYLVTGLEAELGDGLVTRLSYTIDYNSNPPDGAVATDTQTRFSLVYGF